jgi:hypothetical protein
MHRNSLRHRPLRLLPAALILLTQDDIQENTKVFTELLAEAR